MKQNDINKSFQKFTCKPSLACSVYSFACITSLTLRCSLTIQNFATSEVREKWSRTP